MIEGEGAGARRRPARWAALAVLFGAAGVAHFHRPAGFDAIVPRSLPGPPRAWTTASGAVELALAAALVLPRTRRAAGGAAAAFLLAVWPANGRMALDAWRDRGRGRAGALRCALTAARLPLQVPLVRAALRVARGASA
ncbi:DoxX family protein [Kineococcus sp. SYSU DK005]|uniref:hypothetical protein n=1 Tax=Kineococcus sp. SYSU DK005 TaxID=3383126 RepID=UPI003D7D37DF